MTYIKNIDTKYQISYNYKKLSKGITNAMKDLHIGKSKYKILNISSGVFSSDISGHTHSSESYEIHYCFGGKGRLVTDSNEYELNKNSLYITGPGIWHRQVIDKDNPLDEICLYIQRTSKGTDILSSTFNDTHFWSGAATTTLQNLFFELDKLSAQKSLYAKEKQAHLSELIITELAFIYSTELVDEEKDTPDDRKFIIIENAFIFDYMSITLPELSKRLGLSRRQTQRILQQYYGVTFREKQITARLEWALMYLQNGKSVSATAYEVGYADISSFSRAFKKHYGKLPSDI